MARYLTGYRLSCSQADLHGNTKDHQELLAGRCHKSMPTWSESGVRGGGERRLLPGVATSGPLSKRHRSGRAPDCVEELDDDRDDESAAAVYSAASSAVKRTIPSRSACPFTIWGPREQVCWRLPDTSKCFGMR